MNRQQRRLLEREQRLDRKAEQRIMKRQERFGHVEVELYFTAMGLALNDLYGWDDGKVREVWQRTDDIITEFKEDGRWNGDFLEMKADLKKRINLECSFR